MPARILARDQDRQLERVREVQRRKLLRGRLGDEQVAVLECTAEDRVGTALRGRCSSSLGPDGAASLGRSAERLGTPELLGQFSQPLPDFTQWGGRRCGADRPTKAPGLLPPLFECAFRRALRLGLPDCGNWRPCGRGLLRRMRQASRGDVRQPPPAANHSFDRVSFGEVRRCANGRKGQVRFLPKQVLWSRGTVDVSPPYPPGARVCAAESRAPSLVPSAECGVTTRLAHDDR
jgi:hypothetical protein